MVGCFRFPPPENKAPPTHKRSQGVLSRCEDWWWVGVATHHLFVGLKLEHLDSIAVLVNVRTEVCGVGAVPQAFVVLIAFKAL